MFILNVYQLALFGAHISPTVMHQGIKRNNDLVIMKGDNLANNLPTVQTAQPIGRQLVQKCMNAVGGVSELV